jgi:nucleoside-diphosphate-sugar epimerase
VYGPGDRDFLQAIKQVQGRTAWIAAAPRQVLSLLYVHDLVACLGHVASHPSAVGQCWFVTHDTPVTWPSLYEAMAAAVGNKPRLATVPRVLLRGAAMIGDIAGFLTGRPPLLTSQKLALALAPSWVCSADAVERATGWRATTSLATGLEETVRSCRAAGWLPARS